MSADEREGREGFLTRWSRRKRDEVPEAKPVPAPAASPAPEEPEEPFDLSLLPDIESITADTDLSLFFSKGVPEALKNAALRRMWSADPAIRDLVVPADFQWDFNDPNGVPGFGPIGSDVDVQAMLRGVLGEKDPLSEASEAMAPERLIAPQPADIHERTESALPGEKLASDQLSEVGLEISVSQDAPGEDAIVSSVADFAEEFPSPRRRHGGALPL